MKCSSRIVLFCLVLTVICFQKLHAQLCAGTKVILLDTLINDGSVWQLEFEDEFNGDSVDLSKWAVSYSELQPDNAYRLPENVTVSPETYNGKNTSATGVCKITLKKETVIKPITPWDPNSPISSYNYTAGDIWSHQKFGWGKYEIRCKVPKGNNFWSAFCMYGEENRTGNEIDVFEFSNSTNILGEISKDKLCKLVEMHYHLWDKTKSIVPGIDYNCGNYTGSSISTDYSEDFHIFTLVWDRWGMSWYIDNKLIKVAAQWYDLQGRAVTKENIKLTQVVIRNDWFPTLSMAIGVGLNVKGKTSQDDERAFPGIYLIDYVRYYKLY
jgi:hypothetical protein